jgi:SPP1 gp7 family putative phage head morphogenesis protein
MKLARTVALVQQAHMFGHRKIRRRAIPKQQPPRLIERAYAAALAKLVSAERVKHAFAPLLQELPRLLESARAERGDALHTDAGQGKRIRELVNQARDKLRAQVHPNEIDRLAQQFATQTSTYQRVQLNRQTQAALGVDVFHNDQGLAQRFESFAAENVALITDLPERIAANVEKVTTRVLAATETATLNGDLAEQLNKEFGFGERRSEIIARDQIGKLYGQVNATRQQDLGITKFVWRTSEDERVRPEHEALDGQTFSYDDPPDEGLPGEPILCRCSAEPVFDDILGELDDSDAPAPDDDKPERERDYSREETPTLREALGWNYEAPHVQVGAVSGRMLKTPGRRRVQVVQSSTSARPVAPDRAEGFLEQVADRPLAVAEQQAVRRYQGGAFVDFNDYARTGVLDPGSSFTSKAQADDQISALDRAINKGSVPHDVLVYRGVKSGEREGVTGTLEPGATIRDKGFSSTSISRATAKEFGSVLYEIEVPKGTHAAFVPGDGPLKESELLLGRNSAFRVLSTRQESGQTIARVRLQDRKRGK